MYRFCPNCGTKLDKKYTNNFRCKNCFKRFYFNPRPTVSVIPIFGSKIMLGIRGEKPFKGKLDTIGGFLDKFEDPLDGVVREFKEEAGLTLRKSALKFMGMLPDKYLWEDELLSTLNLYYITKFDKKLNLRAGGDVSDLIWISINSKNNFAFPWIKKALRKIKNELNI